MGRLLDALPVLVALVAATATVHAEEPPRIVVVTGDGATMQTLSSRNPRPVPGIVSADSPTVASGAAAPGSAPAPTSAAGGSTPMRALEPAEGRLQAVRPAAGEATAGPSAGVRIGLLALSVGGALGAGVGIGQMLVRVRTPVRRPVPVRRPPAVPYRYAVIEPRPSRAGAYRAARPPRPALTAPRAVKLR